MARVVFSHSPGVLSSPSRSSIPAALVEYERRMVKVGSKLGQPGKKKKARWMLAEVYGWFTEGFDTKDLQEAKAVLAELAPSSDAGRFPAAHRSARKLRSLTPFDVSIVSFSLLPFVAKNM
jgi:hypothetical protein